MLSEGAMEGCLKMHRKKCSRRRQQHLKWQECHKESIEEKMSSDNRKKRKGARRD